VLFIIFGSAAEGDNAMLFLIPLLVAVFLAINMGASGTAPSFSAAYGAKIIKRDYIPFLFGVFVLMGALIAGDKVIKTIGGAVLPAENMNMTVVTIVLLASALSIFVANLLKVPQSTSQSTVFALVGCALPLQVLESTRLVYEMVPTWLIMPFISFFITLGLGYLFIRLKKKLMFLEFKKARGSHAWRYITIACSCYVAFSIGSNNVANSAGPLASLVVNEMGLGDGSITVMLLSVMLVAPWFGIGSALMGRGVTKTIGREIVHIGVLGATFIALITATLLLLASMTRGIPTSLVQMNTFAVIAVGILKEGPGSILSRLSVVKLFTVWIVAPVFAMAISYLLTVLAINIGLLSI
jgi:sulfate permease